LVFPLIRPRKVPFKHEERQREEFKQRINSVFAGDDADLLFFDEAFFRRETTVSRSWYQKGSAPEVPCEPTHDKVGVYGAVNPQSGQMYSLMFEEFNKEVFEVYLNWLVEERKGKRKAVLVLDQASPHKARNIKNFTINHSEKIELLYLPAYSPDLNPIEMVWKDIRSVKTHNRYFSCWEELDQEIADYLKKHSVPNEKLASLCLFNYDV
jgi:transposase